MNIEEVKELMKEEVVVLLTDLFCQDIILRQEKWFNIELSLFFSQLNRFSYTPSPKDAYEKMVGTMKQYTKKKREQGKNQMNRTHIKTMIEESLEETLTWIKKHQKQKKQRENKVYT